MTKSSPPPAERAFTLIELLVVIVTPSSTILMAPNYSGSPGASASWTGPQRSGTQINALFCDLHAETMTFGPNGNPAVGSFKDTATDPLGLKHWDPTK